MSKLESVVRHNPERIKAVETQTGLQLDTGQGRRRGAVNGGKRLKMVSSASLTVYESFIEILRLARHCRWVRTLLITAEILVRLVAEQLKVVFVDVVEPPGQPRPHLPVE